MSHSEETSTGADDEQSESPFEVVSEVQDSKLDIYVQIIDDWIVSPFNVLWSDWRGRFGMVIFSFYLLVGTVGTVVIPPPTYAQGRRHMQPFQSIQYPLGTGRTGESLLSQMVHSTPAILQMIFAGAIFATSVAVIVGTISGYKGGSLDRALMTVTDLALTLPGLPLTIIVVAIMELTHPILIGILLSINGWAGLARMLRSEILSLRQEPYVEASRALGLNTTTIIQRDLLPNVMPYVAVNFMGAARGIIFGAVGLYFLGILPFSEENWGTLLNTAYQQGLIWSDSAHLFYVPLLTILTFSISLVLLAQSLDAVFNPRLRARHQQGVATPEDEEEEGEGPQIPGTNIT